MKRICFFATFFRGDSIPYYIRVWLEELGKYFPEIVLLVSNERLSEETMKFLQDHNIIVQTEKNEGYDFGLWYKALQRYDIESYETVAFINDSSVLFASLGPFVKWANEQDADLLGMTESYAVAHHLQSYFLWCKKPVLSLVKKYFLEKGLLPDLWDVIRTYEIGLSKKIEEAGFRLAAYVSNDGYKGEFSPYYHLVDSHLQQGIPLIKKKILFRSYRKDELNTLARMNFIIDPDYYYRWIRSCKGLIIDIDRLKSSQAMGLGSMDSFVYNLKRTLIRLFRPFYKLVKR